MLKKLQSRKFWMCAAAFLGSIGTSITGLNTGDHNIATVGIVCAVVSAAIYAAAEAYVDASWVADGDDEETGDDEEEGG